MSSSTLHLFHETTGGDWYAAKDLAEAKHLFKLADEDAEPTEWTEVPDEKAITVHDEDEPTDAYMDALGRKRRRSVGGITKTAAEWANDGNPPGYRFGESY